MSLKMMKNTMLVSALVAMGSFAVIGCGDDGEKTNETPDAGGTSSPGGMGGTGGMGGMGGEPPATRTWNGTLVQVLAQDTSAPIPTPHKIIVLDNQTGQPLENGKYTAMTAQGGGTWEIKDVPMAKPIAFHLQGAGSATEGTYDAVTINVTATTAPEPLTRISAAGTANQAEMLAGYMAKSDAAGLSIGVYHVQNQKRLKPIGCVKVVLDDDPAKTAAADIRYVSASGLPVPNASQPMSETTRGAMLFGNIPKGEHKLKFTVDDGKTYFGETTVYITKGRSDATSNFKSILYFLGIEVPEDKTPSGCM